MSKPLKLTPADLALKFPIFPEDTPPPRFTMDEYYDWVNLMLEMKFPRSPDVKPVEDDGPCPVAFRLH